MLPQGRQCVFDRQGKPTGVLLLEEARDGDRRTWGRTQVQALLRAWKALGTRLCSLAGHSGRRPRLVLPHPYLVPTSSPVHGRGAQECCSPKPLGHFLSAHKIEYYSI